MHAIFAVFFIYNHVVFSISSQRFIESAQEQMVKDKKRVFPVYCQASREEASSSRWKDSFSIVK